MVKNALYRSIGESSTAFRLQADDEQTLRVLMYHKVNDLPDNPTTISVGLFDEQLSQLHELGYQVVDLDDVHRLLHARRAAAARARPDHV